WRSAWHTEVDRRLAGSSSIPLSKLVLGASQADPQSFDLPEPALALGLVDPGDQVVADVGQP
ncbi:hypothetical protein ACFWXA_34265, partial [Streptomyces atroolivaceus]